MQRIFLTSYRFAPLVLIAFVALTTLAIWKIRDITVDVSADKLIPQDSPLIPVYESVKKDFGSDELAVIFVEDSALFTTDKLKKLKTLHDALTQMPQVQSIESLFNISHIQGDGGWIETTPLFKHIPSKQAEVDRRKEIAIKNPLLINRVVSKDADATLITLKLRSGKHAAGDFELETYHAIEERIAPYLSEFETLYQIGSPAVHVWMSDYIFSDQKLLLPFAALALVLFIGIIMRNAQTAFIPLLNAFISTALTLGYMSFAGIPVSMLNYIVPALILIIGATEDVHILTEYIESKAKGLGAIDAIRAIADNIGLTLMLTAMTTCLGFAFTGISELSIMQEFGWSAAFGMTIRFIVSVFFLPAYLRFFGRFIKPSSTSHQSENPRTHAFVDFVDKSIIGAPKRTIVLFGLLVIPCLFFIPQLEVKNDLISFLKEDSPIRQKLDYVSEKMSGSKVIYLTLHGNAGDYKQAESLQSVRKITQWLSEDERVDSVTSFADYILLMNQAMFGEAPEHNVIPEKDAMINQYLIFFHRSQIKAYITGDYAKTNIAIRCNLNDSNAINQLVSDIEEKMNSQSFGQHTFTVTGKAVLVAGAVDKIIISQVLSLSGMIICLFVIICTLFLSLKAAILTVVSNCFPVLVVFTLMALFDIPLNIGTCMVAAVTIGIVVDDTLHLMVRYNKELKRLKNENAALISALKTELPPVFTTSMSLAAGFIVLSFSSFLPVMQFGLMSAIVIGIALIADTVLTPVLLSTTRLITLWDVLGFNLRKTLIQTSPMLRGMTTWQAKKLILEAGVEEYEEGTQIITEGDIGDRMFVIIEGEMQVSRSIQNERIIFTTLTLGDVFGEVALISKVRRTADVIAITKTKTLVLSWDSLEKLQKRSPYLSSRLFLNLARILGERIEDTQKKFETYSPFGPKEGPKNDKS